jgi:integrase/recombinase XerD
MNIPKYVTEFRNELQRKGYRENSIKNYVSCVESFLYHFDKKVTEPIKVNESQIKDYLRGFTEHNTQRAVHSAIKTFYKYVCRQPEKFRFIEYCKRSRKLPIVFSVEEIQRLFNACSNLKHRAIIALMYSTGLRVGEVIVLKIENIDSSRMVINILNAKGGKDRHVMLNQNLLDLLRNYFKQYSPKEYLFNGQTSLQYSERSIAQFLKHYAEKAGLNKRIYPHLIRHCSFTHLVEAGTDINLIQRLAGHQSVKTTNLYIQTSHTLISKIQSPLSQISL